MLARENEFSQLSSVGAQTGDAPSIDISDVFGILRRNWLLPVIGSLLGLSAALAYIAFTPPLYMSSARLLIDRSINRYLQANKVIDEPTLDDTETGSQVYVLSSESIVVPVVRSMKLASDPEFVGKPTAQGSESSWSPVTLVAVAKRLVGFGPETATPSDAVLERVAVEAFLRRLNVTREDVQSVISVTFSSEDAKKAADIANAIADNYIASSIDAKGKSTKFAGQLLQDRLADLKQQAASADRVLQDFKIANNISSGGSATSTMGQIQSVNAQLTLARVSMAEAKSRLDLAQKGAPNSGQTLGRVADNEVVLRLRSQYLELAARATEMEARVGAQHAAVGKIRNRMNDVQTAMRDEQRRISTYYVNDYELASARVDELTSNIAKLSGGTNSQTQVTMRELENAADMLRSSHNALLQRFNEISKADAQPALGQDARIITRAAPPLRKASKRSLAALVGGVGLGLLLGLGAALAREFAAGVFRTPDQVRTFTDAYCAILPTAKSTETRAVSLRDGSASRQLGDFVLQAPYSRFTESLRNVKAMVNVERNVDRGRVVGIVSSVAEEGKTTVLTNLAALMATASKKNRVLIVDGDFHRRHLTKLLAPDASDGVIEALADPSRLAKLVVKNERAGFDILPSALSSRIPNAAELLGSHQMERLLDTARASYDFVLIEVPPIMSVVDAKMIERHVDQFILVVEWGRTKRRLVQEALLEVDGFRERLACVVLNKADPAALKTVEGYKGKKFKSYYEG